MKAVTYLSDVNYEKIFFDKQIRPFVGNHHVLDSSFLVRMTTYDSDSCSHSAHVLRNFARFTRSTIYYPQLAEVLYVLGLETIDYKKFVHLTTPQKRFFKVLTTAEKLRMRIVADPKYWSLKNWQEQLRKYDSDFFDEMVRSMGRGLSSEQAQLLFLTRVENGILLTTSDYLADTAEAYKISAKKINALKNLPREIHLNWQAIIEEDKHRLQLEEKSEI